MNDAGHDRLRPRVALMQPYLLPYIGYFMLIHCADLFIVYDDVKWIKNGWINRNRMLYRGKAKWVTLSVKKRSTYDLINQFEISETGKSNDDFLRFVHELYVGSPFFEQVFPIIERIFSNTQRNLSRFIIASFKAIMGHLGLERPLMVSSELQQTPGLSGQDRVLDICRRVGAREYVNPVGGRNLYSHEDFENAGVKLMFIKPRLREYPQFGEPFVTGLSIVDVLMFNSPQRVKALLKEYELLSPPMLTDESGGLG
ncbi:MAG: WbqC family protein [FCB group bacterium]|nr:WbqC family protein [FCB group bacterium]